MKKFLFVISSLVIVIGLCACGKGGGSAKATPTPIPRVDAAQIISVEDAETAIGGKYALVLDGGASVKDGNTMTATYLSDPVGKGDPVIVKVSQYNEIVTLDDVWNKYDSARVKRSSAEMIDGIGEDAYIAYPTIHVYDRGCAIDITAGSGSDDTQKNLLMSLARTAVANLENIMPEVQ